MRLPGTYISPTETGFYYLRSRYYDPEIGRFINADGFASTGQGVLGYNMFAYCLNNLINMKDSEGMDAIYVSDGTFKQGLPVFGHAYLFIQDEEGEWFKTEYAGTKKNNAIVYLYEADMDIVNKMLKSEFICGISYTYFSGDYTDSLALAQEYAGTNYGGYRVLTNNCLHYVKEILAEGTHTNETVQKYVNDSKSIVPFTFTTDLIRSYVRDKVKEMRNRINVFSKPIRFWF